MTENPENAFEADMPETEALSASENKVELLRSEGGVFVEAVRATRMPMVVADPSLPGSPIIFANDAFLRLSGYSMDEVLGQKPHFMDGDDTDAEDAERFRDAVVQDRDEVIETIQYRKDGSRFVASVFLSAFKDDSGATLYQFLSYLDVTRRVTAEAELVTRARMEARLRASEERFRAFVTASSDTVYRMSPDWSRMQHLDGKGVPANTAPPNEGWRDHIQPDDSHEVEAAIAVSLADRSVFELEHRFVRTDGSVGWVLSRAVPIVNANDEVVEWLGSGKDITARHAATEQLRETEDRFRVLVLGIPQLVWRAVDYGDWTWASPQWTAFTGQSDQDSHGWGWLSPVHPEDQQTARDAWERARTSGQFSAEYRVMEAATGAYSYFQTRASPVYDKAGSIVEWLGTTTDVQSLRELQDRQAVLVAELQHRTRNLLAVVQSVFTRTRRSSQTTEELASTFEDRLYALARVQGLLSRLNEGDRIAFDTLIEGELRALGVLDMDGRGDRVSLIGPTGILLRSSTVQTFALALHELATNAAKYGAFAQPGGQLAVTWDLVDADGGQRLHIGWHETGVYNDVATAGNGYGRELIERALPYQLGAETSYALATDNLLCTIRLPVSEALAEAASA